MGEQKWSDHAQQISDMVFRINGGKPLPSIASPTTPSLSFVEWVDQIIGFACDEAVMQHVAEKENAA